MLDQLVTLWSPSEFEGSVSVFVCVCVCVYMCPVCVWWGPRLQWKRTVIAAYVRFVLVAVGGMVVRLWRGGVCVYHVRLCSSSWTINHFEFLCVCIGDMSCFFLRFWVSVRAYMKLQACWNVRVIVCWCVRENVHVFESLSAYVCVTETDI